MTYGDVQSPRQTVGRPSAAQHSISREDCAWTRPEPISPTDLYLELGTANAPVLIDVRTDTNFDPDDRLIAGALPLPDNVELWREELAKGSRFVVYDSQGDEASQGLAEALCELGLHAAYLAGGMTAWVAQGLPTRKRLAAGTSKWITRERPKIDRIACPWLILRFIDPEAEFIYVPAERVLAEARAIEPSPMTFLMSSSPMRASDARSTPFSASTTSLIRRFSISR